MKKLIKQTLIVLILFLANYATNAQVYNWAKLDSFNHVGRIYTGLENGVIYGLHYGKIINAKKTILIPFVDLSLPLGDRLIDDYKVKLGTSLKLLQTKKWILSGGVSILNQSYQNPFAKMQNVGLETALQFGLYKQKWFLNLSISNDYLFATYIKHSEAYKKSYDGAISGWYQNTANNIFLGLNLGYSFKKLDITLSPGIIKTDGFKSSPTLPFYGKLGINYKI
jgi:hypothetical protein